MSRVKLGDVVFRAKEFIDKDNTSLQYYIGGEHFEYGQVCITKKGEIKGSTIGPAFHMKFKPGDVLLMSRNPHLRKAGVVDFEGICSDVSYVCRTRDEEVLLQRYLPFVFQTDDFWNYAEEHKHGSTNFFLNWKDFETYEFELPEIEQQRELTALLWAAQDTKQSYIRLIEQTDALVKSQFIEMFGNPVTNSKGWQTLPISKVAPEYSPSIPKCAEYWWLNLDMIETFSGNIIEKVKAPMEQIGTSTSTFDDSMVLYSKLRPYLNKIAIPDDFGYATTELVGLKPNEKILNKYFLFNLLRGDEFVSYAMSVASGSQMPRMSTKALREFQVILPPIDLQEKFVEFYQQSDKSKFELKKAVEKVDMLIKSLMQA